MMLLLIIKRGGIVTLALLVNGLSRATVSAAQHMRRLNIRKLVLILCSALLTSSAYHAAAEEQKSLAISFHAPGFTVSYRDPYYSHYRHSHRQYRYPPRHYYRYPPPAYHYGPPAVQRHRHWHPHYREHRRWHRYHY